MGLAAKQPTTDQTTAHAFADNSQRFAIDTLLRKHAFRLCFRRPEQEPKWSRDGEIYFQSEAEDLVPEGELKTAWRQQNAYYGRFADDVV